MSIDGVSMLANMMETLRLGWNENPPVGELAWGKVTSAAQITAVLPFLTANYDLGNDVFYTAQKRGSILVNAMLHGAEEGMNKMPDTRWLLLVAYRNGAHSDGLQLDSAGVREATFRREAACATFRPSAGIILCCGRSGGRQTAGSEKLER